MNVKFIGYWKEEGYSDMPSIITSTRQGQKLDDNLEEKICLYLNHGINIFLTLNITNSILDGTPIFNGHTQYTDGKWVWQHDLWHYYQKHKIAFPDAFIQDVKRAFRFGKVSFYFKMFILRRRQNKLLRFFHSEKAAFPNLATDGKHLALEDISSPYTNTINLSVDPKQIKLQLSKYDRLSVSSNSDPKHPFHMLFVLEETIKKSDQIILKINILAMDPSFFQKRLNKQFYISLIKEECYDNKDSSIGLARLEQVNMRSI